MCEGDWLASSAQPVPPVTRVLRPRLMQLSIIKRPQRVRKATAFLLTAAAGLTAEEVRRNRVSGPAVLWNENARMLAESLRPGVSRGNDIGALFVSISTEPNSP